MKRGIDSTIRRYYAEHKGRLHVFDKSGERNDFILKNPAAYRKSGSSTKARRYRQKRLSEAIWHRHDGTVYFERNGHITRVLEKGRDWGKNIPTM